METRLLRRLGPFDLTLITIGAVVGSGIFRTPAAVALRAHLTEIIIGCWLCGGLIALTGVLVFAEVAARRPVDGGLYGYLRDAYHPVVAFLYGWTLLLVVGTGSAAAAAVLFAGYLEPLTGLSFQPRVVAVAALLAVGAINLLGVRQGGTWQNIVVVLKVLALGALVGIALGSRSQPIAAVGYSFGSTTGLLGAIGVAMLPVLFTYAGFQNATLVSGETREPQHTIPRGLVAGICAVIAIYVVANLGYLHVLGAGGLAATTAPAADAMRATLGSLGAKFMALAIVLSTLGYLSTTMLVMPRVYYQMAADGTFFKGVARIGASTHVPSVAILLQVLVASAIALSGTYEQIINWVVAPQWLFIGLGACSLFVFRRRDSGLPQPAVRAPGHPFTTAVFAGVLVAIFAAEIATYPRDTLYGAIVLLTGAVAFFTYFSPSSALWKRR